MVYDSGSGGFNTPGPRDYTVNISAFIGEGWQLVTQNIGGFIGFCVLSFIISIVLSNLPGIALVNGLVTAVLSAGYYIVGFKLLKAQTSTFSDFFGGFQGTRFLPIILVSLVSGLISGIFSIVSFICFGIGFLPNFRDLMERAQMEAETPDPELDQIIEALQQLPDFPPGLTPILVLVGILLLVPAIYFGIAYTFALPIVIEERLEFWAAMEKSRRTVNRHWFGVFGFVFVLGLLNFLGVCLCGLGLLITVPLTYCAVTAAYNNIFGLSNQPL